MQKQEFLDLLNRFGVRVVQTQTGNIIHPTETGKIMFCVQGEIEHMIEISPALYSYIEGK